MELVGFSSGPGVLGDLFEGLGVKSSHLRFLGAGAGGAEIWTC